MRFHHPYEYIPSDTTKLMLYICPFFLIQPTFTIYLNLSTLNHKVSLSTYNLHHYLPNNAKLNFFNPPNPQASVLLFLAGCFLLIQGITTPPTQIGKPNYINEMFLVLQFNTKASSFNLESEAFTPTNILLWKFTFKYDITSNKIRTIFRALAIAQLFPQQQCVIIKL